jgi:hypothetical protein
VRNTDWLAALFAVILATGAPAAAQAQANDPATGRDRKTLLSESGYWRCRYAAGTDVVRTKDGKLVPVHPSTPRETVRKTEGGKRTSVEQLRRHPASRLWAVPSAGWRQAEFDDGAWVRLRGPFLVGPYKTPQHGYRSVPMVCLRGRFRVADPARAAGLTLSVVYHGGVAVFINGKELLRRHLPEGDLKPDTLAEPYPEDAFVDDEGFLLARRGAARKKEGVRKRLRRIEAVAIPPRMLREGVNVLALELHRAPAHEAMFMRKPKSMRWNIIKHTRRAWWSRVGVQSVELSAAAAAPVSGGVGRPKGFQVWTAPVYREIDPSDYGDRCDSPGPLRLCTGRNGVCSGQVIASSDTPVQGLTVTVSTLKGPAVIPASAVEVRYARPGWRRGHERHRIFAELETFPQESGSVQPVWLTVRVPEDARPGDYRGRATVGAAGRDPVAVPLHLRVVDWRVPPPKDFMSFLEFIQSPESVAMHYEVEM